MTKSRSYSFKCFTSQKYKQHAIQQQLNVNCCAFPTVILSAMHVSGERLGTASPDAEVDVILNQNGDKRHFFH